MVIQVFVSRTSGSIKIKEQQAFIARILSSKQIQYVEVDISAGGAEHLKKLMQEKGKRRDGKPPLPPQLFNGEEYIGDYEDFYEACECENLYQLLQLPEPEKVTNPNLQPIHKVDRVGNHDNGSESNDYQHSGTNEAGAF